MEQIKDTNTSYIPLWNFIFWLPILIVNYRIVLLIYLLIVLFIMNSLTRLRFETDLMTAKDRL